VDFLGEFLRDEVNGSLREFTLSTLGLGNPPVKPPV
jgi:hypothetical protein